jgi:dihydropyrimidinase
MEIQECPMTDRVLIAGGRVVTASDDFVADVLVEDEVVVAIGRDLEGADAERHDASGMVVLPGGVDVHTHLDYDLGFARTCDTFETGGKAAAFGGTTTIVDYAQQEKGQSPEKALEDWRMRARSATVDVGAHMVLTDAAEPWLADMRRLIRDEGVTSLKVFTAYPKGVMIDDGSIFRAMRLAGEAGAVVCVHAENGPAIEVLREEATVAGHTAPRYHALTRPPLLEGEATGRVIRLAELAGAAVYIVHVSAAEALEAVAEARGRGQRAFAETCPHYLFLTDHAYEAPSFAEAAKAIMTPPLRGQAHQDALWRGLGGGAIQVVATDHCPFCASAATMGEHYSKARQPERFDTVPNGAPGPETRLPLMLDAAANGRLSPNRVVDLCATAPAKLFGLFPKKGTIAVGSDADLVLFDPSGRTRVSAATHHSRVDYSLFEGFELAGAVRKVFLRGNLIVDGSDWHGRAGMGAFLRRGPSGQIRL